MIAASMMIPPIVGVLARSFISSLRAAWWNSGRSPILSRMSIRMTRGPVKKAIRKLVMAAMMARNITSS